MAKKAEKVSDNIVLERTIFIPGWCYNFIIDRAARQRRDVKAELSLMLEQAIKEAMKAEDK